MIGHAAVLWLCGAAINQSRPTFKSLYMVTAKRGSNVADREGHGGAARLSHMYLRTLGIFFAFRLRFE